MSDPTEDDDDDTDPYCVRCNQHVCVDIDCEWENGFDQCHECWQREAIASRPVIAAAKEWLAATLAMKSRWSRRDVDNIDVVIRGVNANTGLSNAVEKFLAQEGPLKRT